MSEFELPLVNSCVVYLFWAFFVKGTNGRDESGIGCLCLGEGNIKFVVLAWTFFAQCDGLLAAATFRPIDNVPKKDNVKCTILT